MKLNIGTMLKAIYAAGIGIRPEKTRREEYVTLESVYALGVKQRVNSERALRQKTTGRRRRA